MSGDILAIPEECITSDGDGRVIELGDDNAPRWCVACGGDSDYYVWLEGVTSTFYCREHFRQAERKPAATIET